MSRHTLRILRIRETVMQQSNIGGRLSLAAAVLVICAASARPASAQGFISPFFGYNFGGDSSCAHVTDCKDRHGDYGVAFGALGSFVGFEAEIARTNDFLGETPTQSTDVVTFMGNLMLAP